MNNRTLLICIDGLAGAYLEDPSVNAPHLKKLIKEGSLVSRLMTTYPSVTWTANTSAITGCHPDRHGVLGNSVYDRTTNEIQHHWGDQLGSKEDIIKVPTFYDLFAEKGMKTASVCWPLTREATNISYNIPEFYDQALFEQYATPDFWEELKKTLPVDRYGEWSSDFTLGDKQDWLTKEILLYILKEKDADFIMGHFLSIDSLLHDYGNRSSQVYDAITHIDELVGELMAYLDQQETDVILYSDHGHLDVHTAFYPNRLLNENGLGDSFTAVSNDGCLFTERTRRSTANRKQRTCSNRCRT